MSSVHKVCPECGVPLELGKANCLQCGATVGTVFSESSPLPPQTATKQRQRVARQISLHQKVEAAQERANNALALALASFFCPGLGFFISITGIYFGASASRTLRENNVEEGRGPAIAGIVIGVIALVAQVCVVIYIIKIGFKP